MNARTGPLVCAEAARVARNESDTLSSMVSPRDDGGPRLYVEVEHCAPARDGDSPTGVIRAYGEVDMGTVAELKDCLDPSLWDDCAGVLLDATEVRFMDSTALSTLVVADRELGEEGVRFAIATEPRSQIEGLLEITGLRKRIPASLD
jgi:anti-sigma B factor antagonist